MSKTRYLQARHSKELSVPRNRAIYTQKALDMQKFRQSLRSKMTFDHSNAKMMTANHSAMASGRRSRVRGVINSNNISQEHA